MSRSELDDSRLDIADPLHSVYTASHVIARSDPGRR